MTAWCLITVCVGCVFAGATRAPLMYSVLFFWRWFSLPNDVVCRCGSAPVCGTNGGLLSGQLPGAGGSLVPQAGTCPPLLLRAYPFFSLQHHHRMPYLVLGDTMCCCEAYGMRPSYKGKIRPSCAQTLVYELCRHSLLLLLSFVVCRYSAPSATACTCCQK